MAVTLVEPELKPASAQGRKPSLRRRVAHLPIYVVLIIGGVIFAAPFAWLISASFQTSGDIFSWPPKWIPENPTFDGYISFFTETNAAQWFLNSTFVAGSVTFLQLFFNSLAAFVFAKRKFPGRDIIFILVLATMMVPPQVTMIPNYLILQHFPLFGGNDLLGQGGHGMLDSYWGLILPGAVSAFGIFLLRQFMMGIPDELLDAARIDGASEFKVYLRIMLPLSRPVLAATAIFTFMSAWEDFLWPLIILSDESKFTAPLGLAMFVQKNQTDWGLLLAGSVIATLPMVIIFIIFQRQFIQGIAMSGLKG
ncbi:carbohydrate ABC transporter permease [Herbiconiux sp. L3-i23]|uniref:carbohydrate ABC transporter permease n=1 Tax=Herbiconiux sp. L3-i23 TaxID=2905871 RepID=UPI00204AD2F5|nr:carbohydrate ABC transporter permease [Herbiconiux sp. L3-i23]BDI23005.1 bicyclomycin resistance protein [Herbiconiux sp. L3-i23]